MLRAASEVPGGTVTSSWAGVLLPSEAASNLSAAEGPKVWVVGGVLWLLALLCVGVTGAAGGTVLPWWDSRCSLHTRALPLLPGGHKAGTGLVLQQKQHSLLRDQCQGGHQRGAGLPDDCPERAEAGGCPVVVWLPLVMGR